MEWTSESRTSMEDGAEPATPKGRATRQRIVEGAAAVIREFGVDGTTLDDVRARSGTSKSQVFHYFPNGREQLLLAVARFEADRVISDQQPLLGALTTWEAWYAWRDLIIERYRRQGPDCPLAAVTSQLGRTSPGSRAVVARLVERWQAELAAGVRAMQATGAMDPALDPGATAAAIIAGVQGGVLLLMSTGRTDYLEAALTLEFAALGRCSDEMSAKTPTPVVAAGK